MSEGTYTWRNGERIELAKEDGVFTLLVRSESELETAESTAGVRAVERVQNSVYKVTVEPDSRDEAMENLRSGGLVCHHVYKPAGASNTRYYLTDQIVVRFRPGTSDSEAQSTLNEEGLRILKEYPGSGGSYLVRVTKDAGRNPIKVANSLAAKSQIDYAEPNLINRFQGFYTPSDSYFRRQWHLKAWDGPDIVRSADVSATSAWDTTRGGRDVIVAVIDDGFDLGHPDFSGSGKVVHAKDYVDGDSHPFPESESQDYHGTPCAGVAVAEENGKGVVGVAPGCAFMPVRFPLSADDDLLWEIFDYVGSRADVISCSWGPPPVYAPLGRVVSEKLSQLAASGGPRKKGCVIVFAAGNYNAPISGENPNGFEWRHPTYGIVHTNEPILNGNAAHPAVIAVSASTSLNRKAIYSNWGEEISLCAPSNNFHPLDRDAAAEGRGIWTTDNEQFGAGFTGGSRFTGEFGGTSSAAPLVAGIAALVVSANPGLTAAEVKTILTETADKIEDRHNDPILGNSYGTYTNGHSKWFGYGKVNASKAVERAAALARESKGIADLRLRATADGSLSGKGDTKVFRIAVGDALHVSLDGPDTSDFDVYLKHGSAPTTEDYDLIGYSPTSSESLTISPLEPGAYYVMVRSYRGEGEFRLTVEGEP